MATSLDGGLGGEFRSEINVTPLVDVMLVLLVIFMVVTPLLREEVPVELPEAANAEQAGDLSQVTLTLGAGGELRLNGEPVAEDQLVTELRVLYGTRADKTIFLESDRSLAYGRVVDAMDRCREAGVQQIGVLTKRPGESAAPATAR